MSERQAYRPDIDGLRAVSVVVVMLFHLGVGWLPGGFVGVDVFFVISGYLITAIIAREIDEGTFTFAGFYERRIRRIYPALIVVLFATLIGAWVVIMPRDYMGFARTLIAAPLFAANFMFFDGGGYFDPGHHTKPLLHTWSLGVEEQFYIVFPWLLLGLARFAPARRVPVVAAVVALSFGASVACGVLGVEASYFLLPTRFFELGVGALIALARPALTASVRAAIGVAGLAAILGACLVIDEATAFPGWAALVPCLGAAGVILGEGGPAARLLATRPMVFVGRISYPMYLWHWPPIVFTLYVIGRPLDPGLAAALFALTVALSWATLVLVETPIRSRRFLAGRRPLFAAAAVTSMVLVVAGVHGIVARGAAWRLPPQVAELAAIGADTTTLARVCPHKRRDMGKDMPPCLIGDTGRAKVDFAVLGDSHARAVAGEIGDVAKGLGLEGIYLGRVACQPYLGVERDGDPTRRCGEHLDWALERIRALDPQTVVVIGRWAGGVDEPPSRFAKADPVVWRTAAGVVPRGGEAAAIAAGFSALLDALAPRRVIVLFSIPEAGYDVPMVQAASRRFGRSPPADPTRAEYEARQRFARAWMARAIAGRTNVEVVEPADALCDAQACRTMAGAVPLYVDDNHPSPEGAALIAEALRPALSRTAR